jgi:hypothetical protein
LVFGFRIAFLAAVRFIGAALLAVLLRAALLRIGLLRVSMAAEPASDPVRRLRLCALVLTAIVRGQQRGCAENDARDDAHDAHLREPEHAREPAGLPVDLQQHVVDEPLRFIARLKRVYVRTRPGARDPAIKQRLRVTVGLDLRPHGEKSGTEPDQKQDAADTECQGPQAKRTIEKLIVVDDLEIGREQQCVRSDHQRGFGRGKLNLSLDMLEVHLRDASRRVRQFSFRHCAAPAETRARPPPRRTTAQRYSEPEDEQL